jgi:DNA-binding response OmpR family regulator
MRILIVEDHADSAAILAIVLRRAGHDVSVAVTAAGALAACAAESFDLLVSDIGLPDMDGWELLRRLREHCAIPAIALTANGLSEDVERSRAAGYDEHLHKPVDFALLTATVARVGGGGRGGG